MQNQNLHRITGIIVSVFVIAHLFNHLMAWFGIATHQQILENLRLIYRQPFVEIILVGCFVFQIFSGVKLVLRLRKKESLSTYEKIQKWTGIIFGLFITQHIIATISQRIIFQFDTNFYFASRVVLEYPFKFYFTPYYLLGIMAFALHVANVHKHKIKPIVGIRQAKIHFMLILGVFFIVALIILYVFMGVRYDIVIPPQYQVY
jgi:succinate dehydrogenase/fumarate reductase cytochrome b subunit